VQRQLPIGAFGLSRAADLPVAGKFRDWQCTPASDSKGTEALAVVAVEAHRWLREAVPLPALAGLKCLDAGHIEHVHVRGDAGVQ
jgi:hypothetical protein